MTSDLQKWFDAVTQQTAALWPSAFRNLDLDAARASLMQLAPSELASKYAKQHLDELNRE
jgi:hypothetical protein